MPYRAVVYKEEDIVCEGIMKSKSKKGAISSFLINKCDVLDVDRVLCEEVDISVTSLLF